MAQTTITLDERERQFIAAQVASGRYGQTEGDVVRTALHALQEIEEKAAHLDSAIREGLESGPAVPFDMKSFLAEMHRKHGTR